MEKESEKVEIYKSKKLVNLLVILVIILILILGTNIFLVITLNNNHSIDEAKIESINNFADKNKFVVERMMDNYKSSAYVDYIDRIAEQQLIATEFNLQALQIIAEQNFIIIDLLSDY